MWKRFSAQLRCPISGEALTLVSFRETNAPLTDQMAEAAAAAGYRHLASQRDFCRRVDAGVLLAPSAGLVYPIVRGVPLMVPYETVVHAKFAHDYSAPLSKLGSRYRFPSCPPQPDEFAILRSINRGEAHDRGVTRNGSRPDDHQKLVAGPVLPASETSATLLDIGCGEGQTTSRVRRQLKCDAVGVDLSGAVLGAAERFRNNTMLHFVQASAFHLPFDPPAFDIICAHATLHDTYSTRESLLAMAKHCRPGGRFYVWVDAMRSVSGTALQRMASAAGTALRPLFDRAPEPIGTAMLASLALGYVGVNRLRRHWDDNVPPFTFDRALMSARDRLAPTYAWRQRASEVMDWFREAGFEAVEVIDWHGTPTDGTHDERHTGVRGSRPINGSVRASVSY
jgi:SAM-dependent methyltransferase/uncharacterized protein YbaR (Trm112 family)